MSNAELSGLDATCQILGGGVDLFILQTKALCNEFKQISKGLKQSTNRILRAGWRRSRGSRSRRRTWWGTVELAAVGRLISVASVDLFCLSTTSCLNPLGVLLLLLLLLRTRPQPQPPGVLLSFRSRFIHKLVKCAFGLI
jgi:hypothetical protein